MNNEHYQSHKVPSSWTWSAEETMGLEQVIQIQPFWTQRERQLGQATNVP